MLLAIAEKLRKFFIEKLLVRGRAFKIVVLVCLALASPTICRSDGGSLTKAVEHLSRPTTECFSLREVILLSLHQSNAIMDGH